MPDPRAEAYAKLLVERSIDVQPGWQAMVLSTPLAQPLINVWHNSPCLGCRFPFIGGTNHSRVHWDMVKDLRQDGQIFCDGEPMQQNGVWTI